MQKYIDKALNLYIFRNITIVFLQGFEITGPSLGTVDYSHSILNPSQEDNFGAEENSPKVLPTVFKWDGGGKQVYITGTFSNWKTIPMVKRYFFFTFFSLTKITRVQYM